MTDNLAQEPYVFDGGDDQEIQRLMAEYDEAVADEQDAASRAALAIEQLRDMGVDYD